ncbi:SDR family oxidoreductase [Amycolatopsis sp. NPDC047767]|uniref:SDR family oxidoreductase n=1 Tax=Amycolatopsis sp. NPDC047767 TaxID=3156765 RepID=UPI00345573C1
MPDPTDRLALVTGAGRGIGRAVAARLAADGVVVAVHYGQDDEAARLTVKQIQDAGGRAFPLRAEFGRLSALDELWRGYDEAVAALLGTAGPAPVDILVNNAGITVPHGVRELTEADWDRLFAVNAKAPFFLVQSALSRLRDGGRIVNVTTAATRVAMPMISAYTMTKAALETFTVDLAVELGPRGITVNSVAPGFTDTDINPAMKDPAGRKAMAASSALKRVGTPGEVADVISYLASPGGRWVTGQRFEASGGVSLGL